MIEEKMQVGEIIRESGVHRLIVCSELKISLAMLDDFINGNVKMPEELYQKLLALIKEEKKND